jgi:hypothetical protein
MAVERLSLTEEEKKSRPYVLRVRLNAHERRMLERVADRMGVTISEALRYLVRRDEEAARSKSKGK